METKQFEPGDVVALRSGGPLMTVVPTNYFTTEIGCRWMDTTGHLQFFAIDPIALRLVDSDIPRHEGDIA
jgi:uncharacterized protein YodC (DUF2158 family)